MPTRTFTATGRRDALSTPGVKEKFSARCWGSILNDGARGSVKLQYFMNESQKAAVSAGMSLADILYVIFRHKWVILLGCGVGAIAALALPFFIHSTYKSETRLLIKYVVQPKVPTQVGANTAQVQQINDTGLGILNTEVETLTSLDLALQVADAIGPERILRKINGGTNRWEAAAVIQDPKNLMVQLPREGSVLRITFQHPDGSIVQQVLTQLIQSYFQKHADLYRAGAFDDFLTEETDKLRARLSQTEQELRKALSKLGVASVEQAKQAYADQIATIQGKLLDAQAELAEREATANEMTGLANHQPLLGTNSSALTKVIAVPAEKAAEYRKVCDLLVQLKRKEEDFLGYLKPGAPLVKEVQGRILENEERKKELEDENPRLLAAAASGSSLDPIDPTFGLHRDSTAERAGILGLRSKLSVLTQQLEDAKKQARALDEAEATISELQRRRDLEESYYKNFSENLEQSHISEELGAGKVSNISIIQAPSPPGPVTSKLRKFMAMALFGSVAAALGLAFLIEFYLDRSVRHPKDIEGKIRLPLFITIPRLHLNGKSMALGARNRVPLLAEYAGAASGAAESGPAASQAEAGAGGENALFTGHHSEVEIAPWDPAHVLRPFSEALRDRLITYFEIKKLTHKPKLVAVTSCGKGSGVSTIAAGLAASLSETGEGNVLLVDMNQLNGAAQHFHRGDLACGIDDVLERETRNNALVQDNLYVVSESTNSDQLPSILPKRFKNLVPLLKASDFDYIIFDMPPVSQISLTPRLARFMDMVLMVVESGKSDREVVRTASSLLTEAQADVGIVLNKIRSYVPRRLQQEI